MKELQYLALLRGINVGGNNIIKMTALKECFESMGFENVKTYIQSGNVIFSTHEKDSTKLINTIEQNLQKCFNYEAKIVLVTHAQLKQTVDEAPSGFGTDPTHYRYDCIFLKEPLTVEMAMQNLSAKEGVDFIHAGDTVVYHSHLMEKASQSHLTKISKLPIYKQMTIRNWNTTTKLLALQEIENLADQQL